MPSKFKLPWDHALAFPTLGFTVPTMISDSLIKEAGLGRFATEDIPVGTLIRQVYFVDIRSYMDADILDIFVIKSESDLDWILSEYVKHSGCASSDIIDKLIDYLIMYPGMDNTCVYLFAVSGYFNHSSKPNAILDQKGLITTETINKGDEIYWDYRAYGPFPDFYYAWCKKHNKQALAEKLIGFNQ